MKLTKKKRVLAWMLSAVMTVAMLPVSAFAQGTGAVAAIGENTYGTLAEAVAAVKDATPTTIKLLKNAKGNGIVIQGGKNLVFDFGGHTYEVNGTTVGSPTTETNAFQLLKDSTITMKNGTLIFTGKINQNGNILIQNYSDLTLENVVVDGSKMGAGSYTLSNNNGKVNLIGSTSIKAVNGNVAFDVCCFSSYPQVNVKVDTTGVIDGKVELSKSGNRNDENKCSLDIINGTFTESIVKADNVKIPVTISGGSFAKPFAKEYLKDGYHAVKMLDGMHKVTKGGQTAIEGAATVKEKEVAATCTEDGSYDLVSYCTFCKKEVARKAVTVKATGHQFKDGKCTVCGEAKNPEGTAVTDVRTKAVYTVTDEKEAEVEYTKPVKKTENVVIPSTVVIDGQEYEVTSICKKAFRENKKVRKIVVPKSIEKIGNGAFRECKNLKSLTIKTKKLTNKSLGINVFKKINPRVTIRVPKAKAKTYQRIFKAHQLKDIKVKGVKFAK